ncbi:MAG: hypothetical protein JWQ48_1520 [Conexibacter sp.]|nr:hypothetical protein [Conexibacter sp.]
MRRLRAAIGLTQGQASAEYVALLAIVAVVLLAAVALSSGGLGGQVLAGLQRGLCSIAPMPCPHAHAAAAEADALDPCELERNVREEALSETIASVKLGTSGRLTAVRTSDGRVKVTLTDGSTLGGEFGAGAHVGLGTRQLGGGLKGSLGVTWSSGRSWTFPDVAAAQRFVARYGDKATIGGKLVDEVRSACSFLCDAVGWRPHPQLPPPDEEHVEGGALATLSGALGLGGNPLELKGGAQAVLGRDRTRDGATTWLVRLDAAVAAKLELPVAELRGGVGGEAVLAYALDAHGQPSTLTVTLAGEAGGGATAKGGARAKGGHNGEGSADASRGAVVEVSATLDLHDPANRAAAAALVDTLGRDPQLPSVVRRAGELGARIAGHGQIDVRSYALDGSATGVDAELAAGITIGGAFERTRRGLRLLAATTRLPGLPFLPRDDCRDA